MTISDDATGAAELRRAVASAFWDAEAVKVDFEQPFELASGNRSPIYINCRLLISSPDFMRLFTRASRAVLAESGVEVDAVAGGETAGIPYAAYLARDWDRAMLYVRKKEKGYGIASKVEGRLKPGWRVLLVEDLVTDGVSKLGFVDALRAAGAEVAEALVVFDRQQGGGRLLARHGVRLHAVTDLTTTLSVGEQRSALTPEERTEIDAYFADPRAWHESRDFAFQSA
jgi:orotate phosphoribosyltransferase